MTFDGSTKGPLLFTRLGSCVPRILARSKFASTGTAAATTYCTSYWKRCKHVVFYDYLNCLLFLTIALQLAVFVSLNKMYALGLIILIVGIS